MMVPGYKPSSKYAMQMTMSLRSGCCTQCFILPPLSLQNKEAHKSDYQL